MVRITVGVIVGLMAGVAHAQQTIGANPAGQTGDQTSRTARRIGENHYIRQGDVQIDLGDTKIFADEGEFFTDQNRVTLTGNVVVSQGNSRITADHAEFDLKTRMGTFHNAWGMAPVGPGTARPTSVPEPPIALAGALGGSVSASTPTIANQSLATETDVYFFGETIQKTGSQKYTITNGGFTTCVQPTPRWELHSSTVVLNLEEYTVLRNAVFRLKGVPLLYTPFLYYPTNRDDRATGILLPTYGQTTLRGQSIHNAFFWAIDRSQDATIMHDWYSKTGHGLGSEYRYNFGRGADGNLKAYWLNEHETTYALDNGTTSATPATRSYELQGSGNQFLPYGFRARGRVNYFSSLRTMQTLHTDVLDASRNQRTYGGNIVGVLNGFSINGTLDHDETFYPMSDSSATTGSWPRVAFSRGERPLFDSPFYFSVTNEYLQTLNTSRVGTNERDAGLTRLDIAPQIRYPLKRWAWFTANSTITLRDTYYTRSLDVAGTVVDEGLNRRYLDLQTQLVGPVVARVFNTPANGYAEKFKHSIEPFLTIGRTTAIDNFEHIVKLDGTDGIVGGTRYGYGINHRLYAKRRLPGTTIAQSREIVSVDLGQSYYTDQRAVEYDQQSSTGHSAPAVSHFTPVTLNVRVVPSDVFTSNLHAEFDSRYHSLRTISATGTYTSASWVTSSLTWSQRGFIEQLTEFHDPIDYITGSAHAHTKDNRFGGLYALNYDVRHARMLTQRVTGFYNAQCCGLAFEYQTYSLAGVPSAAVQMDHRFFMSFTLAGLGNFSPFNGALSGVPR